MSYAGFDKASQTITFSYPVIVGSGSSASPSIAFNNNTSTGIYSSNGINFATLGNNRFTIAPDGRVGVGTSPNAFMDVLASGSTPALSINQTGSGSLFACSSNGTSTGLIVANNGNVGVNTRTPQYTLHVSTALASNVPNMLALPPVTILEERNTLGCNSPVTIALNQGSTPQWYNRQLNRVVTNGIGVVVSGDFQTFTVPSGTYLIQAEAIANAPGKHRIGLYSTSDSTYLAYGTTEHVPTTIGYVSTKSAISTVVTLTATKNLQLQHWITRKSPNESGPNGTTFGYVGTTDQAHSSQGNAEEVFVRITITKYQ